MAKKKKNQNNGRNFTFIVGGVHGQYDVRLHTIVENVYFVYYSIASFNILGII